MAWPQTLNLVPVRVCRFESYFSNTLYYRLMAGHLPLKQAEQSHGLGSSPSGTTKEWLQQINKINF